MGVRLWESVAVNFDVITGDITKCVHHALAQFRQV